MKCIHIEPFLSIPWLPKCFSDLPSFIIRKTSQSMASKGEVRRVEFRTIDGTMLRGDLYSAGKDNAPAIVMTQGVRRIGAPSEIWSLLTMPS